MPIVIRTGWLTGIRAVERDLRKGRDALRNPDQLTIVTSKGYQGSLASSVELADAGMMKFLNTNMTGLNICYALQILETF
ncbi:hypothetical protein [Scandinavium sp.]|uniref:hypothetical protein n=1 Tax=Scandinavium sp. TaxID=2830653 RepID=UPI002897D8E4|nr:hypothetical protein [Scandinavium sp.]